MGDSLRKFVPRAPRYVLAPQEQNMMRYALSGSKNPIEQTTLLNISETGMAFLAERGTHISIGDVVKVEVPVPESEQIAWFGRVVRIETYDSSSWFSRSKQTDSTLLKIGLRFDGLPQGHQKSIRRGIEASFIKAMRQQRQRTMLYYRLVFLQNLWKIALYSILTAFAIGFIYYFSLPSANYDKDRGTLWGDRFKF